MDRGFGSSLLTKTPFSPRGQYSAKGHNSSFLKSCASGKSTQSNQIILSTSRNYVERFGQLPPVLITEALTFSDRNTVVSARISKNGYAWVVCGRRLLIWQYRTSPSSENANQRKSILLSQCFELQLPQSDLAHKAELVVVLATGNTASCLAVSPEGVIRYWPAIVHEGTSVEQIVDLHGQECDSLTEIDGFGCILATTTCSVVLIQTSLSNGRHTVICKPLKTPSGWLGGFGKRMSSLIFGHLNTDHSSETRLVRVLTVLNNDDSWYVFVLAGHSLQKWRLIEHEPEQLIYVAELNRTVRDYFRNFLWESAIDDDPDIDTWLLDIQTDKNNVVILVAAVNMSVSPQLHYGLIRIDANSSEATYIVKDFLLLKITGLYREDNSADFLSYRLLVCGAHAYLYNQRNITVIKPQEDPDVLDVSNPSNLILAGSVCVNTPIFFSQNHGLIAVFNNDLSDFNMSGTYSNTPIEATSFNENLTVVNNLSIYNMDPDEMYNTCKDTLSQMKAAFVFHVKNQEAAYREIINEIFPPELAKVPGIDTLLDKIVVILSKELLDDIPAGDPRWNKDMPLGIGSSYSMQILHQLEDKQKAFSLFLRFLQDSELWNRLGGSTVRVGTMATVYFLGEFAEKIVAAIVLKTISNQHVLEQAIERTVEATETEKQNSLTQQDIFFREVSGIYRVYQEIANYCEDVSHSNKTPHEVVGVISAGNQIFLDTLKEVLNYRQENTIFKPNDPTLVIAPEYLPWTASKGTEGLLDSLLQMHHLTYNYGVMLASEELQQNVLFDQLVSLTDIILEGRKTYLNSIKDSTRESVLFKQYCEEKHQLIKVFLHQKQWECAGKLAEKYLDFETLVIICEMTNNQQRLDDYIERFNDKGFSEYVYNWFLKENKPGKLLDACRTNNTNKNLQALSKFLEYHPSLSWMQQIFEKKYHLAADTLKKLGNEETESLTRQKTMYSLSKLCKVVSPASNDYDVYVNNINSQLELIKFQEEIPDYVLDKFHYDTNHVKVIPAKDLINLYISKEYTEAGELEFKKALDLLSYIEDNETRQELFLNIWRNAILRDSWNHSNLDSPIELLENKLFFKLVDLAIVLGANVSNLLPPLDSLLQCDSMADLQDNKSFLYLMKTGYEHIYKTQTLDE